MDLNTKTKISKCFCPIYGEDISFQIILNKTPLQLDFNLVNFIALWLADDYIVDTSKFSGDVVSTILFETIEQE
jgi:hypothetical protein